MYMRGCGSGQYSTLTCAHIHLNLWVLPGPVSKPIKVGFYPTYCGYFLQVPIGLGPIVIPKYSDKMYQENFKKVYLLTHFLNYTPLPPLISGK